MKEIPEIRIVNSLRVGTKGNTKGLAISVGMKEAGGDFAIFIDADNATSFNDVLKFIQCFKDGYDVIIASRYVNGAKILKKQPKTRIF